MYSYVSILVMLDDALVLYEGYESLRSEVCLNPCYAGRCSSTSWTRFARMRAWSLNPCYAGRCSSTGTFGYDDIHIKSVSILVMLDDALVLTYEKQRLATYYCSLNPCYAGRCSSTQLSTRVLTSYCHLVSILVMLDDALVHYNHWSG